ncbi:MAG: 50S ribosomal protein L5 [Candidatus Heimdallarchaeota archaeon]|nr:50S ribosomal protein L5 [Candidatus Heimdallarchaeota archaeon]MDH5646218.1 50S ribosomal protein L5 [Candidatus Heimdallarchaeota archaeon]
MSNELPIKEYNEKWTVQPMLRPKIGAVKINCALGVSGDPITRAKAIIKDLTGQLPTETIAKQTWRSFGIRKGQPVGVTVTIRGQPAYELLMRLFHAKDYKLKVKSIDRAGNFGFGINEHIDIPGMAYDPNLGIIGFDVLVQLERAGYRVKRRRNQRRKVGGHHQLTKIETQVFLKDNYGIELI